MGRAGSRNRRQFEITFLNVEEAKHHGLVPPEGPGELVELWHELLLALPVDDEDDGPAAGLQQPHHPVVRLGTQL